MLQTIIDPRRRSVHGKSLWMVTYCWGEFRPSLYNMKLKRIAVSNRRKELRCCRIYIDGSEPFVVILACIVSDDVAIFGLIE